MSGASALRQPRVRRPLAAHTHPPQADRCGVAVQCRLVGRIHVIVCGSCAWEEVQRDHPPPS
jgi:hypothetical protein